MLLRSSSYLRSFQLVALFVKKKNSSEKVTTTIPVPVNNGISVMDQMASMVTNVITGTCNGMESWVTSNCSKNKNTRIQKTVCVLPFLA